MDKVLRVGIEPTCLSALVPKTRVSTVPPPEHLRNIQRQSNFVSLEHLFTNIPFSFYLLNFVFTFFGESAFTLLSPSA
jgi:hypothetical protein